MSLLTASFEEGEIAVFESVFRREIYITRVQSFHLEENGYAEPKIIKATQEQKALWYNSNQFEVVIEEMVL